jgi:hypothetical protein
MCQSLESKEGIATSSARNKGMNCGRNFRPKLPLIYARMPLFLTYGMQAHSRICSYSGGYVNKPSLSGHLSIKMRVEEQYDFLMRKKIK